MKYAKVTFWIAGIWGTLILTPLYFMYGLIGQKDPPPLNHPQFYFGFVSVTLVWQLVFFAIAVDPLRLRPMIFFSVLEKLSFVLTVGVLYLQARLKFSEAIVALPDAILAILFIVAFFKTRPILGNH